MSDRNKMRPNVLLGSFSVLEPFAVATGLYCLDTWRIWPMDAESLHFALRLCVLIGILPVFWLRVRVLNKVLLVLVYPFLCYFLLIVYLFTLEGGFPRNGVFGSVAR